MNTQNQNGNGQQTIVNGGDIVSDRRENGLRSPSFVRSTTEDRPTLSSNPDLIGTGIAEGESSPGDLPVNGDSGGGDCSRNGVGSESPHVVSYGNVAGGVVLVDGRGLLDELERVLRRYVVLPEWAAEMLALWTLHTYAYECRDVTTYIGVESPEKRCGKTTLLTVLSELVNRPVVAANISSPAFFRVIQETQPTLLIDEADTFLQGSDELRGIFNAGYKKKTCFVWRVVNEGTSVGCQVSGGPKKLDGEGSRVAKFSVWCPKLICTIGHLPDTLADRCIVIRMQRKREDEVCERLHDFDGAALREKCERFVAAHRDAIATARPKGAEGLNDRATDIWEPLLALADLAGGSWPEKARKAASGLTKRGHESNPIGSLLMDIFTIFLMDFAHRMSDARQTGGEEAAKAVEKVQLADGNRLFTRHLVAELNYLQDRPWRELLRGKEVTELWLSQRVKPYGIRPKMLRIGDVQSRGYEPAPAFPLSL